jgi:hypothetical protein
MKSDGEYTIYVATPELPHDMYSKCVKGRIYRGDTLMCWGVPIPEVEAKYCEFTLMQKASHGTCVRYWYDGYQWRLSTSGSISPHSWSFLQRDTYENLFKEHAPIEQNLNTDWCYYLSVEDPSLSTIMEMTESKVVLWGIFDLKSDYWITDLSVDAAFALHNDLVPVDTALLAEPDECMILREFNGNECRCVRVNTADYLQRKEYYIGHRDPIMQWSILYKRGVNPDDYAAMFTWLAPFFEEIGFTYIVLLNVFKKMYDNGIAPKFIQGLGVFTEETLRNAMDLNFMRNRLAELTLLNYPQSADKMFICYEKVNPGTIVPNTVKARNLAPEDNGRTVLYARRIDRHV